MEKFTKINLNGVEKFVSAIYDGSGNEIESTYETIENVAIKELALSERIDTTNESLETLAGRVTATEAFSASIEKNALDIQNNSNAISTLQSTDVLLRTDLDSLTIKVETNTSDISTVKNNQSNISSLLIGLQNKVSTLEATVNDESSGINALNTLADQNTTAIASATGEIARLSTTVNANNASLVALTSQVGDLVTRVEESENDLETVNSTIETLNTSVEDKVSKADYDALLARVIALEEALVLNHPTDTPETGDESEEPTE